MIQQSVNCINLTLQKLTLPTFTLPYLKEPNLTVLQVIKAKPNPKTIQLSRVTKSTCRQRKRKSIKANFKLLFLIDISDGPDDEDDVDGEQQEADDHDHDDANDDWLVWTTSEKRRKRSVGVGDDDVDTKCPGNGVFDLGACKFGTPLLMSW